jgi:hypothetical protein
MVTTMPLLKKPFIVIGSHGAGSTSFARMLSRSGIFLGNDCYSHGESNFFLRHNEALLQQKNSAWYAPVETNEIPAWSEAAFVRHYLRAFRNPVALRIYLSANWGWKDPRNTFTLDSWIRLFPQAGIVHVKRNGDAVAAFLFKRDANFQKTIPGFVSRIQSLQQAYELWRRYYDMAEKHVSRYAGQSISLSFDLLQQKNEEEWQRAEAFFKHRLIRVLEETSIA